MTKPHEEEWELNPIQRASVVLKGERKTVIWAGNPLKATTPEDVERARLAVKAPEMARLLMLAYSDVPLSSNRRREIEALLKETGAWE